MSAALHQHHIAADKTRQFVMEAIGNIMANVATFSTTLPQITNALSSARDQIERLRNAFRDPNEEISDLIDGCNNLITECGKVRACLSNHVIFRSRNESNSPRFLSIKMTVQRREDEAMSIRTEAINIRNGHTFHHDSRREFITSSKAACEEILTNLNTSIEEIHDLVSRDVFVPYWDGEVSPNPFLHFDFNQSPGTEDGISNERKVYNAVFAQSADGAQGGEKKMIAVIGEGGLGKSCAVEEIERKILVFNETADDGTKQFPDGVYHVRLEPKETDEHLRDQVINKLAELVQASGGVKRGLRMTYLTSLEEAVRDAVEWFRGTLPICV